MLNELQKFAGNALYVAVKVLSGLIVLPLGMLVADNWEWWEQQSSTQKWVAGLFFYPAQWFLWVAAPWWDNL